MQDLINEVQASDQAIEDYLKKLNVISVDGLFVIVEEISVDYLRSNL